MDDTTAKQGQARHVASLREAKALARDLRAAGDSYEEISTVLRARFGLNARVAFRLAHGWTQEDVAREWNGRWPDDLKTHKNISYWETWRPGPRKQGYAPSFDVLDKLAQIYSCTVGDLLADLGDHRSVNQTSDPPSELSAGTEAVSEAVTTSQRRWRQTRRYLNQNRAALAKAAAGLYQHDICHDETGLLAPAAWLPNRPVDLGHIALTLDEAPHPAPLDGSEPEAQATCPLQVPQSRFPSYTSAIRYVDPPTLFENRPSYRLLKLAWANDAGTMTFGLATYFDKLDISEALGHELAAATQSIADGTARSTWSDLPYRRTIGDPFDLPGRPVIPAITTLTLIHDHASDHVGFLLHWRDPASVATAGGQYDVIPAGEFQPSSVVPWAHLGDLDLWRNIVREYSEELRGTPEHDGSHGQPVDYDNWPFYRAMSHARAAGRLHAYCLGVGLDALTLAATVPTVVVIDHDAFTEIFGPIVRHNAEGTIITALDGTDSTLGIPFTEANVQRFLTDEPLAPPGAACLSLAWRHRHALLDNC